MTIIETTHKKIFNVFLFFSMMSIIANLSSLFIGIAWGDSGNPGYLEKLNWSLFPVFFIIMGFLVHSSWHFYLEAWKSLPIHKVLYRGKYQENGSAIIVALLSRLTYYRTNLIILSIVLGLTITIIDAGCLWSEYGVIKGQKCMNGGFGVAYSLPNVFPSSDKISNGLFNIYIFFLQGMLIASGWLAFFQITLHGYFFWKFEETKEANSCKCSLKLNIKDGLSEFGLSEINRAVNVMYTLIAIAMLIPVTSVYSQDRLAPYYYTDLGQWLLRLFVPLLLLAPLIIPIIDRFSRQKEASNRVASSPDKEDATSFKEQKLWPFEGTQAGYFGKVAISAIIIEYSYVISFNIMDLYNKLKP